MARPDKYPYIDTRQPDIFARIVATAQQMRKVQRSHEYLQQQKREEQARGDRLAMREREAAAEHARKVDAEWRARIRALPSFENQVPKL